MALSTSVVRPSSLLLVLAAVLVSPAAASGGKTGQITVFWGRHEDEGTLGDACDFGGIYTAVNMAFLDVYGHGRYHLNLSGHPLAGVGDDIKHCQSLGIPVFLSIGGDYGLPDDDQLAALHLADHLWHSYLGGSREGVPRPFGDAQLDGVDFFIQQLGGVEYYEVLALELAKRNRSSVHGGGIRPVRLTATTPRSAFPDRRLAEPALATGPFERIHVRFYDDYPNCTAWIEEEWQRWAAAYPDRKIYLGLTASDKDACYIQPKAVYEIMMPIVHKADNYGGVMLWDRYGDEQNVNQYSSYLKSWA